MNRFNKSFGLLGLVAGLALCAPAAARADQSTQSFQTTNRIDVSVVIVTDPTNSAGVFTGQQLRIDNYDKVGFYVKGSNASANASAITVKLTRGIANGGTPSIGATNRDFETVGGITLTFTTPAATGLFTWYTNLPPDVVGAATTLGIQSMTNATASATFQYADFGISKKVVPTRFP